MIEGRLRSRVFLGLLLPVLLAGCSSSHRVTQSTSYDEADDSYSQSASISLGDGAESRLEYAGRASTHGQWEEAEKTYREVYENPSNAPEHRAEALYGLGHVSGNLLNPRRDPDQAVGYFERVREEFPETAVARRAGERLEQLRETP